MEIHDYVDLARTPFTWQQARELGIRRHTLNRWCAEGTLTRMLRDVYISTDVEETVELRARALMLVVPAHVIICDRTAAWLHGIDALDPRVDDAIPKIETCVPPDRARIRRPEARGGTRELAGSDVEQCNGLVVTTALRTALDLGRSLWAPAALAVLDAYLRLGSLTAADLRRELPRFRGRRGVVQLRRLLALADPRAESPGESWVRWIMSQAGLPEPELQFRVIVEGVERYRLDLAYPRLKICIEYDGVQFHDTPAQRAHDHARREWLRRQGWIVFVLRKEDLGQLESLLWTNRVQDAINARIRNPYVD